MNHMLSQDSLAIVLLCTPVGLSKDNTEIRPLTIKQWNQFLRRMFNAEIKNPAALFELAKDDLKMRLSLSDEESQRIQFLLSRAGQAVVELENLNNMGIFVTTRAEKSYPQRLKSILKKDSPPVLFYSGDIELTQMEGIGIVGSRNIDPKGLEFTKELGAKSVKQGLTVISGGAKGVDEVAQNEAIRQGGKVISILAESLAQKIKHKEVREAIIEQKLLLLSPFHPRAPFTVYNAMQRNKYIYALSHIAVVVSSDYNKGGTWAGATENLRNKWVPLFVRRDDNIPEGNEKLLKMGATPLLSKDLFAESFNTSRLVSLVDQYYEQGSLFPASNLLEREMDYQVSNDPSETDKEERTDLFPIIWPYLENALQKARTKEELCEMFNLNKNQMKVWLDRAVEEQKIKKVLKPTGYIVQDF
ncbi:putative DNA protecting protein DprA [Desulfitobacterium hafniense DP7]|uniref:Putative DNA protecting protein DprA n=1 Tax=Desulfitobacterium hafniense DP7 TaxID=537010 RepID=G9XPY6_DESHA|nr:DNA-processing protein DprA [Desulfitobacterium hafniense]EHL06280.1 putative DNA protecting protein DprA [Desulfitobacterium hafniense DP7]